MNKHKSQDLFKMIINFKLNLMKKKLFEINFFKIKLSFFLVILSLSIWNCQEEDNIIITNNETLADKYNQYSIKNLSYEKVINSESFQNILKASPKIASTFFNNYKAKNTNTNKIIKENVYYYEAKDFESYTFLLENKNSNDSFKNLVIEKLEITSIEITNEKNNT